MGTIIPKLRARIEAKVSGRIAELPVYVGKKVKKGDLIAQLSVEEIQAKLQAAMAQLERARKDLERFRNLLAKEAVTQAEFDAVQAQYRTAEAAVKEARTMLEYARVVAPFDGVITRKMADIGDLVGPGRPIVEMETPDQLQVEANLPEELVSKVKVGMQFQIVVPAVQEETTGVVREISPAADPASRTFLVKLDLTPKPGIRSGQFARVRIPIAEAHLICLPQSAVVTRGQLEMVFVVTNNIARMRIVKTGKKIQGLVDILSGLQPGEEVVIENAQKLHDGQRVKILPSTSSTKPTNCQHPSSAG